jgi:hypothetical protein
MGMRRKMNTLPVDVEGRLPSASSSSAGISFSFPFPFFVLWPESAIPPVSRVYNETILLSIACVGCDNNKDKLDIQTLSTGSAVQGSPEDHPIYVR